MIRCILICASRFKDQGVTNALKKKTGTNCPYAATILDIYIPLARLYIYIYIYIYNSRGTLF